MSAAASNSTTVRRRPYARNDAEFKSTNPRNLVLLLDGTTNTFDPSLTNLPELFSLLSEDPKKQLCYYQSGIGTYYEPGDKIFLFGFSRGAHTARALAGMLQEVGLLPPGNEQTVSVAYDIYAHKQGKELGGGETIAQGFKKCYSRDVHVRFVGVWDTVASVGAIYPRTLPFATGTRQIEIFRQALSLDERRARFSPQFWMHPPDEDGHKDVDDGGHVNTPTNVREVWFAGAHSDVGGGNFPYDGDTTPRLSHIPLRWLFREAMVAGIQVDAQAVRDSPLYGGNSEFNVLVQGKIDSKDPLLQQYASTELDPHGLGLDIVGLIQFASRKNDYMNLEAVAPRGDSLSFRIQDQPGFKGWFMGLGHRFVQRSRTFGWWILEIFPTLKIIGTSTENRRRYSFLPNLGFGRVLQSNPIFHESVRIRLNAKPDQFGPGNGKNVPEKKYQFHAKFRKGEGMENVTFEE
ncbi:DUF2235 family protein [Pseudohyphozyma bogoriensis]|nr:DUF2235 family protein [Pseudohyphozyma bogoriensis]